jgi:hypothetical protein
MKFIKIEETEEGVYNITSNMADRNDNLVFTNKRMMINYIEYLLNIPEPVIVAEGDIYENHHF